VDSARIAALAVHPASNSGTPRIDRAVGIVLLTRLVPLIAAPITLLLVATKRSIAEQGLYFIYWNVQALSQLMEVGIGSLIVQFASHESTFLSWSERGALTGDVAAKQRLYGVVREGLQWYGKIALVMLAVGASAGTWLLQSQGADISPPPLIPWLVTIATTAAYLPLVPLLCAIEGCGGLLRVQAMRLVQVTLAVAALWCVLPVWGALWGVATFSIVWLSVAVVWLARAHSGFVAELRHLRLDGDSMKLGPGQWRVGMTWLALWIAPQALTPVVLAVHGPSAAGQVGMSLAIATAPLTLASAWLTGRYPRYGAILARGAEVELNLLAARATLQAVGVFALGSLGAVAAMWLLGRTIPTLAARALSPAVIGMLGLSNLAWLLFQSVGGYLRAWREEPSTEAAAGGAAIVVLASGAAAFHFSTAGTVATYSLVVVLVMLPLAALILVRHRRYRSVETPSNG
jgi:hypothetical protein